MKRPLLLGGIVVLFVIVMLAAAVQGVPRITPPTSEPQEVAPIVETAQPLPQGEPTQPPKPENELVATIISVVLLSLLAAVALFVLVLFVRALVRAWRDRPQRFRDGGDVGFDLHDEATAVEDDDAAAPVIQRGIDGALRTIDERRVPSDAIIAAWVGLEEGAADAGISRSPSETASEFALRIITRRRGIEADAARLLALYERVRYGGYVADEADRDTARAALHAIEEGWR